MRLALDVHQSFCEVAICEQGKVRSAGRVKSERAALELFAESLDPTDQVVMEATGPALEIARIIEPHVARVVVAKRPGGAGDIPRAGEVRPLRLPHPGPPARRRHAGGRLGARGGHTGTAAPGGEEGGAGPPAEPGPRTRSTRPSPAACSGARRSQTSSARPAGPGSPARSSPPQSSRPWRAVCARSTSWAKRSRRSRRGCVSG